MSNAGHKIGKSACVLLFHWEGQFGFLDGREGRGEMAGKDSERA